MQGNNCKEISVNILVHWAGCKIFIISVKITIKHMELLSRCFFFLVYIGFGDHYEII